MKTRHMVWMLLATCSVAAVLAVWQRMPLTDGNWTRQTLYVSLLNLWQPRTESVPYAMLVDDDSGRGVFAVKAICDAVGISPVFAVIPETMEPDVADSLAKWQRQGAGIVLHGLKHQHWQQWDAAAVSRDISQSRAALNRMGFDTTQLLPIVVPPHAANTRAIRSAIARSGCQMVTGANVTNPSRNAFLLGRIWITPDTNISHMRQLLQQAYNRREFVILATHSSMEGAFSAEKTQQTLEMAKDLGFHFHRP